MDNGAKNDDDEDHDRRDGTHYHRVFDGRRTILAVPSALSHGHLAMPVPLHRLLYLLQSAVEVPTPLLLMPLQVLLNLSLTRPPRANTTTTMTAAIAATRRPYSTAEAPSSLFW